MNVTWNPFFLGTKEFHVPDCAGILSLNLHMLLPTLHPWIKSQYISKAFVSYLEGFVDKQKQ